LNIKTSLTPQLTLSISQSLKTNGKIKASTYAIRNPLRTLPDLELLNQTAKAAASEKAATLKLLEYLCEVDLRKAYATKAFSSLFDYIVRGLATANRKPPTEWVLFDPCKKCPK